jgi:adenylate cyclase
VTSERSRRLRAALLLGLTAGIAGVLLAHWPPAESLELSGLDWLFALRGVREPPPDICVVALDQDSYDVLGCPPEGEPQPEDCAREDQTWPRALHARLIRQLKKDGARSVAFDVLFLDPQSDRSDGELAAALKEAGNVVIGSDVDVTVDPRFAMSRIEEPYAPLAESAAVVADVGLPTDRDGVIRRTWLMREDRPSLALAAYETATGDRSHRGEVERWIDYYGPARTVKTVSYYQALDPGQYLPAGFFKGKIVFVGLAQSSAVGPAAKDSFPTPFRPPSNPRTYGVEIHATLAANLLAKHRIDPLPAWAEAIFLLLVPVAAALLFLTLRPIWGAVLLFVLAIGVWAVAAVAFASGRLWLPLIIPSVVQLPAAYVLCLIWYYLTTVRERERIRKAFNFYLSPEMIARIVADPSSLNLGGEEIVATALFTDVKGFTSIAESMPAPETAAMLNSYFSELTQSIFTERGTLIKFIGDAVFAIWGAPLRMEDHAARACSAALTMAQGQSVNAAGGAGAVKLVTRIGVHTGPMLVGNLGSEQRFDYTAIGDAVNLASRLESLNKQLGTTALASGETIAQAGDGFIVRSLGRVRVVGKQEPVALFELLGRRGETASLEPETLAGFAGAMELFLARRFEQSAAAFEDVRARIPGGDVPCELYIAECRRYAAAPPPPDWDGTLVFEKK